MKIALIGYGKMGHIIRQICLHRGHEIVAVIDADNREEIDSENFRRADVAIEFTTPAAAVDNYLKAFAAGVPVVSGTTGWLDSLPEIKAVCDRGEATFFHSSNFSIGVNIFMAVNRYLARIMNDYADYEPTMTEIHHIHKLDHPSGTAITLAQGLLDEIDRKSEWTEQTDHAPDKLLIEHRREGEVPGTHEIRWESDVDLITITHEAKSRAGFALGAVMAAEWIYGKKPGLYTMSDMLNF